jgi:preprotein translocase subunit SecD
MNRIKQTFKSVRVIILVAVLLIALFIIRPYPGREGVAIASVAKNSSAYDAGIENPKPNVAPMNREVLTKLDGRDIADVAAYNIALKSLRPGKTVIIETNSRAYSVRVRDKLMTYVLPELENKTVNVTEFYNATVNGSTKLMNRTFEKTITVNKTRTESLGPEDIGLRVLPAPTSNIRQGLDIQGGTRVLLKPERELTVDEINQVNENMKQRLNVYGLSDVIITDAVDLSGHQFFLIEIAGLNEEEVKELLSREGKFEATIGKTTVFAGGQDITYVCRSATCSGLDPQRPCQQNGNQWTCGFYFQITLTPEAAKRQADATRNLAVVSVDSSGNKLSDRNQILNQSINLYLDNKLVDKLNIGKDLKGREVTNIQISGGGSGPSKAEAALESLKSMKTLQTVLITGSLPVKLEVVQTNTLSPVLGKVFLDNAYLIALISMLVVSTIIYIRYRHLEIVIPIIITMLSEVFLTLGLAAFIGWNIDLAAIAGIIVAVGTGVDDQIVITDEVLKKGKETTLTINWKERIKRAFFIVFSAYFVTVFGMIPLFFAGAGLLKGFAITTILGVSVGVFITRPAYAAACEALLKE